MARINLGALAAKFAGTRRSETAGPATASERTPAAVDQLGHLRSLVLGGLTRDYKAALERIEERAAAETETLCKELGALEHRFEQQLSGIHEVSSKGQAELSDLLCSNLMRLNESIERSSEDAVIALSKGCNEIRSSKLDRAALTTTLAKLGAALTCDADTQREKDQ